MEHIDVNHMPLLAAIEKKLHARQQDVEEWFLAEWQKSQPPIYGSVDLRNAGFKISPVDMNLFPAGFNNLSLNPVFIPISIEAARAAIHQLDANAKSILLIPESHTRNVYYWENIYALLQILKDAGMDVRVGTLLPEIVEPHTIELSQGKQVIIEPMVRKDNKISVADFVPDIILLNNDLSDGVPDILTHLDQKISPPPTLGWNQRLKSRHFQCYASIANEFANFLDMDPWLIQPLFFHCGEIDFMKREGEECLASEVEKLFALIQKKYDEYNIQHQPYIVIKADAGTYGMAVMMVKKGDDVRQLNRKQRTHMSKSKGGQPVTKVIIQEGVYSFETWGPNAAVAEPVVYLWGQYAVGGFYRVHKERGVDENLNSPGMSFEPLVFAKPCQPLLSQSNECFQPFYLYGVIARLSMLAAAREMLIQGD